MSSDRITELEGSLEVYEQQLGQVRLALEADAQNEDLNKLVTDLSQLISLTSQNLLEEKRAKLLADLDEAHPEQKEEAEHVHLNRDSEPNQEKQDEIDEDEAIDLKQFEGKEKKPKRLS